MLDDSSSGTASATPRKRRRLIRYAIPAAIGVLILLNCSGLTFPMLTPRRTLTTSLKTEINVVLPSSTTVVSAARVAYRDPSRFYLLNMTPQDADALAAAIQTAGGTRGLTDLSSPGALFALPLSSTPPTWWTPSTLPGIERADATAPGNGTSFTLFHVPGSRTAYLFWCAY